MIAKQILVFFLTKIFNLRKTTKNKLKKNKLKNIIYLVWRHY